ncbi:MAG: hypothetical protein A2Y12_02660 [Planctomycetes bacterium GWF2_42_9]|nr:MAG: hypothetical protein A2Y12_02660 [Planctomycetes bacterium GWF2_42_9]HAL44563.1 hypothetical protein [Phycisphaerales bacterium]
MMKKFEFFSAWVKATLRLMATKALRHEETEILIFLYNASQLPPTGVSALLRRFASTATAKLITLRLPLLIFAFKEQKSCRLRGLRYAPTLRALMGRHIGLPLRTRTLPKSPQGGL